MKKFKIQHRSIIPYPEYDNPTSDIYSSVIQHHESIFSKAKMPKQEEVVRAYFCSNGKKSITQLSYRTIIYNYFIPSLIEPLYDSLKLKPYIEPKKLFITYMGRRYLS